ncbi:protein deadpan-like isoform X2 [Rhodnius prolixus]
MEKRRRARINNCLDELKTLILDAMKKDPARHSKLEKADILEMTVKHLQEIQREQMRSAVASDPSVLSKFHNGFTECATEVSRYISCLDGVDDGVRRRLVGHLTGCVTGLSQVLPLATSATTDTTMGSCITSSPEDVNNNRGGDSGSNNSTAPGSAGGLRMVPSRLPSGELAILLPGMDEHRSAFKAVISGRLTPTPSPVSPTMPPSPAHSLHSSSSEHISTSPEPHHAESVDTPKEITTASTSDSQTNSEMWRPW